VRTKSIRRRNSSEQLRALEDFKPDGFIYSELTTTYFGRNGGPTFIHGAVLLELKTKSKLYYQSPCLVPLTDSAK
jgi:hypothetical protein